MNEDQHEANEPGARPSRPRSRRRYPWILLALVLVLLAVVAAAPALVSTPPVRDAALGWYNRTIAGEVSAADLSLSWLGGQSVRDLVIADEGGETVLRLGRLETDLTLLDALRGRLTLGRTVARGLDIDLRFADDGTSNLARALAGEPGAEAEGGGLVAPITGNMTLVDGRISVAAPGIDPIVLEDLSGEVTMAGLDAPIQLAFSGRSRQGDLQGSIDVDGQINDLFRDGELDPGSATATVNAGVEDLPVDALDRLMGFGGMLSAALGERTSVQLRAGGDAASQDVSIEARSPNAAMTLEGAVSGGRFRLQSPAEAQLTVTPGLIDLINSRRPGEPPARLAQAVPLRLQLGSLDMALEDFALARVALDAELSADDAVRLTGIENLGDLSIGDLRLLVSSPGLGERINVSLAGKPVTGDGAGELTLEADIRQLIDDAGEFRPARATVDAQSTITGIPTTIVDAAMQQDGLLVDAVGDVFALELNADTDTQGRVNVAVDLDSERVRTGPVQVMVNERISLAQPARLALAVTPSLWRRLLGDDAAYQLTDVSEWTIDLETLSVPLPAGETVVLDPAAMRLKATVSAGAVALMAPGDTQATRLEGLRVDLDGANGLQAFDFSAAADILQPGGTLASLNASPLRVSLAGATGLNDDASVKPVTSSLELSGDGLSAAASTVIEEGFSRVTLTEPASFGFTLTPDRVAAWQDRSAPAVTLGRNAELRGNLDQLVVPLSPFDFAGLQAGGEARLGGSDGESVQLVTPGGAATQLDSTRVSFELTGADGGRGRFDLNAGVRSGEATGELALEVSATRLLNDNGQVAMDAATLELDGTLQHLPVALLDQVMDMGGTASATLGPSADIELSSRLERMRGPLSLSVSAPNATAEVRARLGDDGLTLTEPLVAQVEPTPEFGSQVLAKVHPIFETTQRAERPIRFEMPAEGVLVPVENYDFSRITVPAMTLDFGKIVLKSGWLLRGIIDLGRRFGKLENVDREEFVAWFTPGVMAIRDGRIVYSQRLDLLLAERLHLATWGAADVAADRSDLVLAFMPGTMERVFSITVADDDALHIPITGPLSSPGMDLKKAGADLARLRAQEEVSGENPLAGALLGAVTGKATGSGGGPVPPPSMTPLPWAEQLEALDAADARDERSGTPESSQEAQPETGQTEPQEKRSTEEEVIRGLIDIFGRKKE